MKGTDLASANASQAQAIIAEASGSSSSRASHVFTLALAGIFIAAFAIRIWYNFFDVHVNNAGSCDGAEYLRNARALWQLIEQPAEFWHGCLAILTGAADAQVRASLGPVLSTLSDFQISGPVFPLFVLLCWLATNSPAELHSWQAPLLVQSLLSSMACVLIALIGRQGWGKGVALTAGIFAAVYPGFIVNSGRLYTESFATFLTVLSIWLMVRGFGGKLRNLTQIFLLGFTLGLLQLTRSVMVALSGVSVLITLIEEKGRRRFLSIGLILVGFACAVLPWMAMQKVLFDKSSMVVDRIGHYNLFIGTNTNTAGWLSYPYPNGADIEKQPLAKVGLDNLKKDPTRWCKLLLDKPLRLFKFPWNDFRTAIGPFSFYWQVLLQQALLILSAIGLCRALFVHSAALNPTREQMSVRLFLAGFLAFHFVYCFFITVPRYALTAMPCIVLFAAAGLRSIIHLFDRARQSASAGGDSSRKARAFLEPIMLFLSAIAFLLAARITPQSLLPVVSETQIVSLWIFAIKTAFLVLLSLCVYRSLSELSGNRLLGRIVTIALALFALPLVSLPLYANGRSYEWRKELAVGESLARKISLSTPALKATPGAGTGKTYFVLLDLDGASAFVDGGKVTINGKDLNAPLIPGIALIQDFSRVQKLRKDRIALECEWIFDAMSVSAGLGNTDLRQWFFMPVPDEIMSEAARRGSVDVVVSRTGGRSPIAIYGYNRVSKGKFLVPSIKSNSWEKMFYGVENDSGLSDGRYEDKLSLQTDSIPGILLMESSVDLKAILKTGQYEAALNSRTKPDAYFSVAPPALCTGDEMWLLRLTGLVKAKDGQPTSGGSVGLVGRARSDGSQYSYLSVWYPRQLPATSSWTRLDTVLASQPALLPGRPERIDVTFETPSSFTTRHLNVKPRAVGSVEVTDVELELMRLSGNPLNRMVNLF